MNTYLYWLEKVALPESTHQEKFYSNYEFFTWLNISPQVWG
jgi:hypothetical protein